MLMNDMAGFNDDSWATILRRDGHDVNPVLNISTERISEVKFKGWLRSFFSRRGRPVSWNKQTLSPGVTLFRDLLWCLFSFNMCVTISQVLSRPILTWFANKPVISCTLLYMPCVVYNPPASNFPYALSVDLSAIINLTI